MRYYLTLILLTLSLLAKDNSVVLQLDWKNQFQFAGFYVAKEKGFYRDVGLDVKIKEYDNSIDVANDVVSQKATFGLGRSSLLLERDKGKPIVALCAIYQHSPSVLITTNPKITELSDLRYKRVMTSSNAANSAAIIAMLNSEGISKKDIIIQKHSFNINDLIKNKTDAMSCFISNEPYFLKKQKIKYRVFDPKDYGYDFYGDMVFTSEAELKNNPKTVHDFNEASKKGWLWAFDNIEKTAKLIYEKYNTQNKPLESLIYEGHVLKNLALVSNIPFGNISRKKFEEILKVYKLNGMLSKNISLDDFIDPMEMNKEEVKIGVLAKRGKDATHERWDTLAKYLNKKLDTYHFTIVPLDFTELKKAVKDESIDFVITNTMYYVQLENRYGVSRIATLVNGDVSSKLAKKEFGGVIFTRSNNSRINSIEDLDGKLFGAVSPLSFGGWIMGYEELLKHNIDIDDIKIEFLNTHDAVVYAVLSKKIDAGTVRTDTLERMSSEGSINLSDIKVLGAKKYNNFPYLVSTKLYPEWPIAKLTHTSDALADKLLAELVSLKPNPKKHIDGWTVPLDYSSVHDVLKRLEIDPYNITQIKFMDILKQYSLYIYILGILVVLLIARLVYVWRVNKYLNKYNVKLDNEVKERTKELKEANKKLKVLANTDSLTGINNRGYFMKLAKQYFNIAKRNNTTLQILSLDLDYFKTINDTYGHQAGDKVLKEFAKTVSSLLRKSDIFGRVGGEEFSILLQNTSTDGAQLFAKRVCDSVEAMTITFDEEIIHITVSIGMAELSDEENIDELLKKSDEALYRAKENGRNRVHVFEGNK